jgi:hypothetical protein
MELRFIKDQEVTDPNLRMDRVWNTDPSLKIEYL